MVQIDFLAANHVCRPIVGLCGLAYRTVIFAIAKLFCFGWPWLIFHGHTSNR